MINTDFEINGMHADILSDLSLELTRPISGTDNWGLHLSKTVYVPILLWSCHTSQNMF